MSKGKPRQQIESADVMDIQPHPENARVGNVELIAESLKAHGQYKPLVVQRTTNHVLAGNHTLQAARLLGWREVDVVYVDVDDAQAKKILLIDNRSGDESSYDNELLLGLLDGLGDLDGTGYDAADLDMLRFDLLPTPEPVELPRDVESKGGEETPNEMIVWGYLQFGIRRVTLTAVEVERLNALHDLFLDENGTDAGWGHKLGDGLDAIFAVDSEALAVERLSDASRVLRAGKRGRPAVDGDTVFSGTTDAPGVEQLKADAEARLAAAGTDGAELPTGELEEEDE